MNYTQLSDEDISDILQSNGISEAVTEEPSAEDLISEAVEHAINSSSAFSSQSPEGNSDDEGSEDNKYTASASSESTVSVKSKLPPNSPSLLVNEATTRFSGAEWFSEIQKARVIIAGIGGIGSNVAFQIARMAPANITLYDGDSVEAVNMAGQLYSYEDLGKPKVDAMATMISVYTTAKQVNAINGIFTGSTEPGDIMICGFDNMRARKMFFNSWNKHVLGKETKEEKAKCLYLDGRLSMDTLQVLCLTGDDEYNINRYMKEFLFEDYEAEQTVCSMKQTTYLACMIGSLMTNLFTNFVANSLSPVIPYDLPFFTEYDSRNMLFKTEN